jgi:hypothetical protein
MFDFRPEELPQLSDEQFRSLLASAVDLQQEDRKQNQILFYRPVSERVQRFHDSQAKVLAAGGGNRSAKTTSMLVEMTMCSTGVFPYSQSHLIEQKFRGPIHCRLVVESLTATLEPVIIPKLQWWKWSGADRPGGARGHWGWIPKNCLIDGQWERSWSSKNRMLRLLCRDPHDRDRIVGESTWQFMSKDQDPTDFASGEFHIVGNDEPPTLAQWKENQARVMSVNGRLLLAMTWPDDPSINVDWLYNEVYEPARSGQDPDIEWLELWTTDNQQIDQGAVAIQAAKWSTEITNVRIFGKPIRFSNRIHPEFSDHTKTWCFKCEKSVIPVTGEFKNAPVCPNCQSENLAEFNHVEEFSSSSVWPTVFLLDPHPRKPHMYLWAQISPSDDWFVIADGKCDGDCVSVRKKTDELEQSLGLYVAQRLMDPNMGASPSGQRREVSWQDEFAKAGLNCELACDIDIGRARVNTMLKVDPGTMRPRLTIHPRCRDTIYQLNRYSWGEFNRNIERDLKQQPKDTNSDYPTLLKYLANAEPSFRLLKNGAPILSKKRRGAYG